MTLSMYQASVPVFLRTLAAFWGQPQSFEDQPYLLHFALPNLFFHATTAYDILRHCGVEVGKRDFIGPIAAA